MRLLRLACAALLLILAPVAIHAHEAPASSADEAPAPARPSSKASLVDGFTPGPQETPAGKAAQAEISLASPGPGGAVEPETRKREQAAWRAYYDYKIQGLQHRGRTFAWQLLSQKIIFVMVLFLVFVGIYFSWLQFRSSLPPRRPATISTAVASTTPGEASSEKPAETGMVMAVTEISAGRDGLKVSSPVLGVIILVISLLFFYLYLVYIYPIGEIF